MVVIANHKYASSTGFLQTRGRNLLLPQACEKKVLTWTTGAVSLTDAYRLCTKTTSKVQQRAPSDWGINTYCVGYWHERSGPATQAISLIRGRRYQTGARRCGFLPRPRSSPRHRGLGYYAVVGIGVLESENLAWDIPAVQREERWSRSCSIHCLSVGRSADTMSIVSLFRPVHSQLGIEGYHYVQ
jgi:hypothetical protein